MKTLLILFAQILLTLCENLISFSEFRKAVTDNTYPTPTPEQYDIIMKMAESAGNITSKHELSMFLAQVLWESAGLQHKKEIKCAGNGCPTSYRTGREQPGKYYYGRGYIQLTWIYNYEQCSKDLYGDNRLVDEPDLVSDTEEGAWGSAFWYWSKHCHNAEGVKKGQFGASTMAINGGLECKGPYKVKAFKRFTIYVKVLKAFKLNDIKPLQEGCYPMEGTNASDFRLCESVGPHKNSVGMYHWCNDNCNAEDPNCPEDICVCEGGNPQPKPKLKSNQTEIQTQNEPKIEPILTQIPYKVRHQNRNQTQIQPKRNPIQDTALPNHRQNLNPIPDTPLPNRRQILIPTTDTPHPNHQQNPNPIPDIPFTNRRQNPNPIPDIPFTNRRQNPNPIPDIPFTNRRQNPNPTQDTSRTNRRQNQNPIPDPTLTDRRQNHKSLTSTESQTPVPNRSFVPKLTSETDLFRYQEPMRIRPIVDTDSEPNLFQYSNPVVNTTSRPEPPRTRLLRNELGRLIRKRPVNRIQQSLNENITLISNP